jgi:hypothetical protein
MKWRSHLSIGRSLADVLQLSEERRRALLDGMVEPDRHKERISGPGYCYRVSHHRAPQRVIMLHVWMARRAFLRNDERQGYRHLGMALHYVQDRSTSKGFFGLTHNRREERMAGVPVPRKMIERGLRNYTSSPEFVGETVRRTRALKDPEGIMAQASLKSAMVSAAVLDLSGREGLRKEMRLARRRHALLYVPLAVGSLALGVSLSLAWSSPLPILTAIPFLAWAIVRDRPYRRLDRLARWNGLSRT